MSTISSEYTLTQIANHFTLPYHLARVSGLSVSVSVQCAETRGCGHMSRELRPLAMCEL